MPQKSEFKSSLAKPTGSRQRLWLVLLILLIVTNLWLAWVRAPKPHDGESWIVRRIVNGQTLEASLAANDSGIVQRVNLIGISAPPREQRPWGLSVRQRLEELLKNQTVIFEFDEARKDNSDRLLVYVWFKDRLVNSQLVAEGYALADPLPPNLKHAPELSGAQLEARLLEVGIWNPQNPMRTTPKDFRRQLN